MKKLLLTVAAAASLAFAVQPDLSNSAATGFNLAAASATAHYNDDMVNKQIFITDAKGLPDTLYIKSFNNSTPADDTMQYHLTYTFSEDQNFYERDMYFPSFTGEGLDLIFRSKYDYNNKGLTESCSTFVLFMGSDEVSISRYHYNNSDQLQKIVNEQSASTYQEADTILFSYGESGLVDSVTYIYLPGSNTVDSDIARSITTYTYEANKLIQTLMREYNSKDSLLSEGTVTYTLKTSPLIPQAQNKTTAFELSLQNGRILHLSAPETAQCHLVSPLGRVIRTLKLSPNGTILGWNGITSGYYILKVKQGQQSSVLPFVK